jgi:hypothetical protein
MSAKLRHPPSNNLLRTAYPWGGLLGRLAPHLLYANLVFGKANTARMARSLLNVPGWSEERALRFLEENQEEFRRCVEWLSNGSLKDLGTDEGGSDSWAEMWEQEPEVKFLQSHGLNHGKALLKPVYQDRSHFSGIALIKSEPADPLDPICWHMLALLVWEGTVGVLRCKYDKCGMFFRPVTQRKVFCSDACRAKNGAAKKTPEERNKYMRDYRKIAGRRKRQPKR